MSALDNPPPVAVELPGPCRCLGEPHDHDIVYLHAETPLALGVAAHQAIKAHPDDIPGLSTAMTMEYVRHGICGWTFRDDEGRAIPLTADAIERALPFSRGGYEVSLKAVELYDEDVLRPLLSRIGRSSRVIPITASTSASPSSSPRRRKRSA